MERLDPRLVAEPDGYEPGLVTLDDRWSARGSRDEGACAQRVRVAVEGEAVDAGAYVFVVDVDDAIGVEKLGAIDDYRGG